MSDDLFGDGEDRAQLEVYEAHRSDLMTIMSEFAEQRNLDEGFLAAMLLEVSLSLSSLDYVVSVEKPSESGLKLHLDRYLREFGNLVRLSKKDAKNTVTVMMAALDGAETADNDPDERLT
jgi:U3 small nucleolar ribonucleoprotein component